MASGKSTLAPAIAEALGRPVVEMDDEIERRAGQIIADIFEAEGEAGFRARERDLVLELSAESTPQVVSTGGGVVETEACIDAMRRSGRVVWLDVPWPLVERRLRPADASSHRPLARGGQLWERFERRRPAYERAATAAVRIEGDEPLPSLVQRILGRIEQ